jgi:hypothetical protein
VKQLASIVVMGLLGMLALVAMAGYGTQKNPRLRAQLAVEHLAPVEVERCEVVDDRARGQRRLALRAVPRAGAPAEADLALRVALAAAAPLAGADGPAPSFDYVEVELPGAAPVVYDRLVLLRWKGLADGLPTLEQALAPKLGPGSRLAAYAEKGVLNLEARPARADLDAREAAAAIAAVARGFAAIRVVSPGKPPAVFAARALVADPGRGAR